MTTPYSDGEVSSLLEECFKKIKSGTENDTKKLSDMNNTLNWILTLTTFFFIFYSQQHFILTNQIDRYVNVVSKIIFVLSISILVIHKIFLVKYESSKGVYMSSLTTHYIDLKFNIEKVKSFILKSEVFQLGSFINKFRKGKLSYNSVREITIRDFKALEKKINSYGNVMKLTYNSGIILFIINFLLISFLIFR